MTALIVTLALIAGIVVIAWSLWAEYQAVKKGMQDRDRDDKTK